MKLINALNKEGFNLSLEYIHRLYELRNTMRRDRVYYKKRKKLLDILISTKKKINYEIGRMPEDKIFRYLEIKDPPSEFDGTAAEEKRLKERDEELKILKKKYNVEVHSKLYELIKLISSEISWEEAASYIPGIVDNYDEFFDNISHIRLDPLKLIFNVWHKELRKGNYGDNKTIERIILEFNEKVKGTEKEYLFKSLNPAGFESLRKKSLYKLKSFYYDLANFIYKKSFIEKKQPK